MKISIIIVLVFSLYSCNNSDSSNSSTENDTVENVVNEKTNLVEIEGIYAKGGHDDSYAAIIELEESGEYSANYAEIDGMLPPADMFDVIEFTKMSNFRIDSKTMKFTSDNGNGEFVSGEVLKMVFFDKKDFMGDQLVLAYSTD